MFLYGVIHRLLWVSGDMCRMQYSRTHNIRSDTYFRKSPALTENCPTLTDDRSKIHPWLGTSINSFRQTQTSLYTRKYHPDHLLSLTADAATIKSKGDRAGIALLP